jgi:hypothetical protein
VLLWEIVVLPMEMHVILREMVVFLKVSIDEFCVKCSLMSHLVKKVVLEVFSMCNFTKFPVKFSSEGRRAIYGRRCFLRKKLNLKSSA